MLALLLCSSALVVPPPAGVAPAPLLRAPRAPLVSMADKRWSDPILDESLPDPVFSKESPYLGRVPYGFSDTAEKLNGRAAMMGFTLLLLQEAVVGEGVLTQYGLPYDAGAIVETSGSSLNPAVGLGVAVAITAVVWFAGLKANDAFNWDGKQ